MDGVPSDSEVLLRFLRADAEDWPALAGPVVAGVGLERLRGIVAATRERVGDFRTVSDSRDGLVIDGPAGKVLAWARTDSGGMITGLLLDGSSYRPPRIRLPAWTREVVSGVVWAVLVALTAWRCWQAGSVSSWIADVIIIAALFVLFEAQGAPARLSFWVRRGLEAGGVLAVASLVRLPGLAYGRDTPRVGVEAVLFVAFLVHLVRARRHRWQQRLSAPLRFPLAGGRWYVVQGGGRALNHHARVVEQRGAVDVVGLGRFGTRRRPGTSLDAYAAYGAPVYAPCGGRVVSAVDGLADQRPGVIRYGPVYGNHVFLDTGHETVKIAHLRRGSVAVTEGQTIRAGDLLGEVGSSGNSTEPHLHLHAERDGQGLDLDFTDVPGRLVRGRVVRTSARRRSSDQG